MTRRFLVPLLAAAETATLLAAVAALALVDWSSPPRPPRVERVLATTTAVQLAAVRGRVVPARPVPRRAARHPASPEPSTASRTTRHGPPTPSQLMRMAVARIPGYRPGEARWVMTRAYGHWGVTNLWTRVVYISPGVPPARMYDVVSHEWSHVLSVRDYGMDVGAAVTALTRVFGGMGGVERAADCMARLLGARWTHYTACRNRSWRRAARALLAHHRV